MHMTIKPIDLQPYRLHIDHPAATLSWWCHYSVCCE